MSSSPVTWQPFVSVIIPVLNQRQELARCLRALGTQSYPADRYEVIVVDNGSQPPLGAELGDHPGVRHILAPTPGSYAARNRGIEAARGEVLAFTDADCVPAADWIGQGVAAMQALHGSGMLAGRIDIRTPNPERLSAAELFESVLAFPQAHYVSLGFAATANLFTFRATFDRTGLFDERLMSGGDVEWGHRVRALALPQAYADQVRVTHDARRTLRELGRKARRVAGGVQLIAEQRGTGIGGLLVHANEQLILLRRIRANLRHAQLSSVDRKLRFAAAVWLVEFLYVVERLRVYCGGTARRT
jgi:GT2 family glycosyltransferase